MQGLDERQRREVEYHRERAEKKRAALLAEPVALDVVRDDDRRWWNAYWATYTRLRELDLKRKRVLVVGCGFGEDAIRLSYLCDDVHGFDLSPDALDIARQRAQRDAAGPIDLRQSAAERLPYDDDTFDVVVCVDILHHCDIPATMAELSRVAKPEAVFVADEVFTHSRLQRLREAPLVERHLYPKVAGRIYGGDVYITEDERKLDERDLAEVKAHLNVQREDYFNLVSTRLVSGNVRLAEKADRLLLRLPRLGPLLGGRVVLLGRFRPTAARAQAARAA
jgi:ubiquinone/menaquinone biosynthesis C-methylase UbiE